MTEEAKAADASRQELERLQDALGGAAEGAESSEESTEQPEAAQETPDEEKEQGERQEGEEETAEEGKEEVGEPKDNAERSRLGRRIANIERELTAKLDKQDQTLSELSRLAAALLQGVQQPPGQPTQEEEDEYIPTTKAEMKAWLEREQQKAAHKQQQTDQVYVQGYLAAADHLGKSEEDSALYEETKKLIATPGQPFNRRYSDDPIADATRNYYAAQAHILKQRISQPSKKNPLKGGEPKNPLGAPNSPPAKSAQAVKMTPEAAGFLRSQENPKTGKPYTEAEIQAMMAGR